MYIDFMGDKAGIRLQYQGSFVKDGTKNGMLRETKYQMNEKNMFQQEIDRFLECIRTVEKLPSNIDVNIITSKLMGAIYQSAEQHCEVALD